MGAFPWLPVWSKHGRWLERWQATAARVTAGTPNAHDRIAWTPDRVLNRTLPFLGAAAVVHGVSLFA